MSAQYSMEYIPQTQQQYPQQDFQQQQQQYLQHYPQQQQQYLQHYPQQQQHQQQQQFTQQQITQQQLVQQSQCQQNVINNNEIYKQQTTENKKDVLNEEETDKGYLKIFFQSLITPEVHYIRKSLEKYTSDVTYPDLTQKDKDGLFENAKEGLKEKYNNCAILLALLLSIAAGLIATPFEKTEWGETEGYHGLPMIVLCMSIAACVVSVFGLLWAMRVSLMVQLFVLEPDHLGRLAKDKWTRIFFLVP
eukprot:Pgem_evm1s17059